MAGLLGAILVDIPEAKMLVQRSRETARPRAQRRQGNDWSQPKRAQFLAADIHFLILDFLDLSDAENYAIALERSIPDSYWRQLATALGLIFEYDIAPEVTLVNWMFLAKGTERLPRVSIGMENRLRIRGVLQRVSYIFHSLKRRSNTSLHDFVNDTYPPYTGPLKFNMKAVLGRQDELMDTLPRYNELLPYPPKRKSRVFVDTVRFQPHDGCHVLISLRRKSHESKT